jgi:hypothetical protein
MNNFPTLKGLSNQADSLTRYTYSLINRFSLLTTSYYVKNHVPTTDTKTIIFARDFADAIDCEIRSSQTHASLNFTRPAS